MDKKRLVAWYEGRLPDEALSEDEIQELMSLVMDAVAKKVYNVPEQVIIDASVRAH